MSAERGEPDREGGLKEIVRSPPSRQSFAFLCATFAVFAVKQTE
jgi:hypothetical protein